MFHIQSYEITEQKQSDLFELTTVDLVKTHCRTHTLRYNIDYQNLIDIKTMIWNAIVQ